MRKNFIVAAVVFLIFLVSGGIINYTHLQNQNPKAPTGETDTLPMVPVAVDEIRDAAMVYLAANHSGTIIVMDNLAWIGGR